MTRLVLTLVFVTTAVGCNRSTSPEVETQEAFDGRQVSSLLADLPVGKTTDACNPSRRQPCEKDGVCLKFGHEVGAGFRCSKTCERDSDCSRGWSCMQLISSSNQWYCAPSGVEADAGR
jgi:hypothetical protein